MNQEELIFQLSDADESIVRTYECITLKRWFVPQSTGFLTVTNKRVVFHSTGQSLTGKSLLMSEMPLEDVAGFSVYEGLSINWVLFIVFTLLAYALTQTVVAILPRFMVSFWFAALLMAPAAAIWLLRSSVLSDQFKGQVLSSVPGFAKGVPEAESRLSEYSTFTRIPLYLGLAILAWRLALEGTGVLGLSLVAWLILLIIYGYIFFDLVGRRRAFVLQIGSKAMKDTGIFIPGNSFNFLPGRETIALQGLGAQPAGDASKVIRELGALIMDMQQLGDLGIGKWKVDTSAE